MLLRELEVQSLKIIKNSSDRNKRLILIILLGQTVLQHPNSIISQVFLKQLGQIHHRLGCAKLSTLYQTLFVEHKEVSTTRKSSTSRTSICHSRRRRGLCFLDKLFHEISQVPEARK